MKFVVLLCAAFVAPVVFAQPATPPPDSKAVIRSTTHEVMLDVVVRDKKGKLVRELKKEDFEVTDEGTAQEIRSFRLVSGSEAEFAAAAASAQAGQQTTAREKPMSC